MKTIEYIEIENHGDIVVKRPSQNPLYMLGSGGRVREERTLQNINYKDGLPVFLGIGFGYGLLTLCEKYSGPIAIIDKENDIQDLTKVQSFLQEKLSPEQLAQIFWINSKDTHEVLQQITYWQTKHGALPLISISHPFYLRFDKDWYSFLREQLHASQHVNFWDKVRKPRFAQEKVRILLITSKYFLMGELAHACESLGIEHQLLTIPDESIASSEFIKTLLNVVLEFQPDFLLTLNHLGIDREGVLMNLLEQLQMPLASWFVDNPHLIVHSYQNLKSPWVTLFTWDADNVQSLNNLGFPHVFYLPLGTNPKLFSPNNQGKKSWASEVSFVGNSMLYKVEKRLAKSVLPDQILENFTQTAQNFNLCQERSVVEFLQNHAPKEYQLYQTIDDNENKLGYETALTWEATRIYRSSCVEKILEFSPLIVGDDGWHTLFKDKKHQFRFHSALSYYDELPKFYPLSDINFNCTSKQMKGAVNQRIFDAPACNAFVLTDWREQMDNLLEPHKEIIFYTELDEIPELIRYYLAHPKEREAITAKARKRILSEHTWAHRIQSILKNMRNIYGKRHG